MEFSNIQDKALMEVKRWLESGDKQVFYLFGYAGTGKTTLARHFAEGIDGTVLFGAYTGKAAHVLRSKGCLGASTIHSMIYHTRDKSKARLLDLENELAKLIAELKSTLEVSDAFIDQHPKVQSLRKEIFEETKNADQPHFTLNRDSIVKGAELVIIDECSMVDDRMGSDLLSFDTPILVLGDPAQLPPVGGAGYFTENVKPDVMLTEIHRQAADSPIIRMATKVRNKEHLNSGDYGDGCMVLPEGYKIDPEEVLLYDQILVGKNKTRFASNNRIRQLKGIQDPYPVLDDRIVCLRNNHELGLLNGAIFHVTGTDGVLDRKILMSIQPEDSLTSIDVSAHEHHFIGEGESLKWYEKKEAEEFDYGYALTVHKAQGSQWKSVCVFDESWCFRSDKYRWLYTGITRAAERVTVAKM